MKVGRPDDATPIIAVPSLALRSPERMGHSVLICDDTPAMRAMLRRVLEQGGFTVAEVKGILGGNFLRALGALRP